MNEKNKNINNFLEKYLKEIEDWKSEVWNMILDKIFEKINLKNKLVNFLVLTEPEYLNFEYKWIKKEPTKSFNVQLFWLWFAYYINNFSFTLRSKKNNRPILINWGVVNKKWLKWLESALKTFLYSNIKYWQKQSIVASQIMKMVFLWKDEELKQQEKLLHNIYELTKNTAYVFSIKLYEKREILKYLYNLFKKEFKNYFEEENMKLKFKEFYLKNKEKIEELKTLNIVIIWSYDFSNKMFKNLKEVFKEFEVISEWKRFMFKYLNNYLSNFIFYSDYLHWKFKKIKLSEVYKDYLNLDYSDNLIDNRHVILEYLKEFEKENRNSVKKYLKYLFEWFSFQYKEIVLNSFLTQTDLSNSLELLQDTFQKFLQTNQIQFDDMYITKIDAEMLRFNKKNKENTNLKNISFFGLEKI